ncbi:hypothetical protein C1T21_19540 [Paenibacillus sp. F4]|nr:hypothetical protein C1T21_19540 [Paenibacillus sp. F4]
MIRVMNTLSFMYVLILVMIAIKERGGMKLKRIMYEVSCDLIHKNDSASFYIPGREIFFVYY